MALAAALASGCAAVAPRLPVPLPEHAVAVGAFGAGGGGVNGTATYQAPYVVGLAGGSVQWQAIRVGDVAVEVDAALGGGLTPVFGTVVPLFGALVGARGWYLKRDFALGVDGCLSGMIGQMEAQQSFQGGGTATVTFVQPELRALGAVRIADQLWFGTRPGLIVVVPANPWNLTPAVDVPLALVWDASQLRFGLEGGWVVPYGGRGGASVSWVF